MYDVDVSSRPRYLYNLDMNKVHMGLFFIQRRIDAAVTQLRAGQGQVSNLEKAVHHPPNELQGFEYNV